MLIKIDYRETDLLNKITTFLSMKPIENLSIVSENLPLGDIIICDNAGNEKIIIERKTLQDLAASIRDGRYKEQAFRLNACNMPNHNIIYLVEGNLQYYKPFYGKAPIDKYALLSSMVSINYYKGFSLFKTNHLDESAEWIIQTAYKLGKEGGHAFYRVSAANETAQASAAVETAQASAAVETAQAPTIIAEPIQEDADTKYSHAIKRIKKNNITPENIGEIMLGQIPNVSCVVASVIMEKYKSIKNLLEALSADKKALDHMTTLNKAGQARKISKTSIANIYNYLVAPPPYNSGSLV